MGRNPTSYKRQKITSISKQFIAIAIFFLGISDQGGKVQEVNPVWSTNPWNKARPQHREYYLLLFPISAWVL